MSTIVFANNAQTTLAGAITNTALTANLSPGSGAEFTAPGAGQYFVLTFVDAATGLLNEIVHVTAISGDTITMVRGQESTTALSWQAGDIAAELWTAGQCQAMVQTQAGQGQATNYAVDTGSANAYVAAFTPPLTALTPGMPLRVKIIHTNTGASTLNGGTGPLPIVNPDGTPLSPNTLIAGASGSIYEFTPDAAGNYQLSSASDALLNASGLPVTGDWKWRADASAQTGWVRANALTVGNGASGATERANADTANLFAYLWNTFGNTQCPVSGGRGANATADFASNKTITLLDARGMGQMGLDGMGNSAAGRFSGVPFASGNATTAGSVAGENVHTLAVGELPSHTHGVSGTSATESVSHAHTYSGTTSTETAMHAHLAAGGGSFFISLGGGTNAAPGAGSGAATNSSSGTETATHAHTFSGTTSTETALHSHTFSATTDGGTGGGGTHNTVHLNMLGTYYIKL